MNRRAKNYPVVQFSHDIPKQFIESLPPGPWRLFATTIGGEECLIAASPEHPARFYRNGRRIEIWGNP